MASPAPTRLTYDDLAAFPDDHLRRELVDGQLVVTPAPRVRHQEVVLWLAVELTLYARARGGKALCAPLDVYLSASDVVEPDVLYVAPEHLDRIEERFVRGAPDVVVEVSSPSTRELELGRKRDLYERFAVPEYWYVDLDADRVAPDRRPLRRAAGAAAR
ncbi:MAG: Uma2 family endonuclease [Actinomycetota bacterium]|nr:Uma2 family endonuclease [Actinomycetota bacterium]